MAFDQFIILAQLPNLVESIELDLRGFIKKQPKS
jgi:hypothetical protein